MLLNKFSVFIIGSLQGMIIDYLVALFLNYYFNIFPVVGLALAMTISSSVVFLFHEFVTFSPSGHGRRRRYFMFVALTILIFLTRSTILVLLMRVGATVTLGLLSAIGLTTIISFTISQKKIFYLRD